MPVTACTNALSFHSLVAVSFGGVRCYSKRSSFWIVGYFDHWVARSGCRQRFFVASDGVVVTMYVINGYVSWKYCTSKLMSSLHFPLAEVHAMDRFQRR